MSETHDQNARQDVPPSSEAGGLTAPGSLTTHPETHGLIVNADDWGRNRSATDRTLDCVRCGAVSSVSAMVFMEDSERAAAIAISHEIDAGLHVNFTSSFTASGVSSQLVAHQKRLSKYLVGHRFSRVVFHPGLIRSFEYVMSAQQEEFIRLYKRAPKRLDGHHHMHLSTNVLLGGLLPPGTIVRRNFSFQPGEKSFGNRCYRRTVDWILGQRHQLTDLFFSIQPLTDRRRLRQIAELSRRYVIELETHPEEPAEHKFLTEGGIHNLDCACLIAPRFEVCR
jgi:chitin disaccharide deacetylase